MGIARIVAPTDFSDCSRRAVQQAVDLARSHGAELHLFHVVEIIGGETQELIEGILGSTEAARDQARERLDETLATLQDNGVSIHSGVERSLSAASSIMDKIVAVKADLVVMGTHGRTGVGRLLLGSVTEKVVRYAACEVMTVPPDGPLIPEPSDARFLVPVDFSNVSMKAISVADGLLAGRGRIVVLHVIPTPIYPAAYALSSQGLRDDPVLASRLKIQLREGPAREAEKVVIVHGEVVSEILMLASREHVNAIVIGNRGLSGSDRLFLGSVSEKIVRHSGIPVLVVK